MPRKKTHGEFIRELKRVDPTIQVLGKYVNAATPIQCECLVCHYVWLGIPNNLLRDEGCMNCTGHLKKTSDGFIEEMGKIDPTIKILGRYENNKTPILCRCEECKNEWSPVPSSLLRGHGCKPCSIKARSLKRKKSQKEFLEEVEKKNPGVLPLGEYVSSKTPVKTRCVCGNENWYPTPSSLFRGSKCKRCAAEKTGSACRKTNEEFADKMKQVNPNVEILGEYTGIDNRIRCQCKVCEHIWEPFASAVLRGTKCPKCQKRMNSSFPEQAIYYYVKKAYPNTINSYREGFGRSEIDVFIPSLMIAIEYDGRQWHKDSERIETRKYDICRSRNIKLIRVRERRYITECIPYDHIIYSEYGDTKRYCSLDSCIRELLEYMNIHEDVDCERDRMLILEQYMSELFETSLGRLYPHLVSEWYQPMNGGVTPFMIKPKSNISFFWECPDCKVVYPATPANRTSGTGCSKCAKVKKLTQEEFVERVALKFPKIKVRGTYTSMRDKVECECERCGLIWSPTADTLLFGSGCKTCSTKDAADDKRLPEDEFRRRVKEKSPSIIILGKYKSTSERIECRCGVCQNEWSPRAGSLLAGYGCANCKPNKKRKVLCVETGKIYDSTGQIKKELGIDHSCISKCCNKGDKYTAGGYHWKFADE